MADVRLDFYDLDADELPDVCMRCGEPSTVRPVQRFSWMPPWARFVPPLIGVWFIKRQRVATPLCDQHKNYWRLARLVTYGGLGLVVLLFFAGLVMLGVDADTTVNGAAPVLSLAILASAGILFIVWLIVVFVTAFTRISAAEITDDTITLKNVHSDFRRAYRNMARDNIPPEVEKIVREKSGKPSKRRRPADDDDPPNDKYRRG